jgi:hypothetical protein
VVCCPTRALLYQILKKTGPSGAPAPLRRSKSSDRHCGAGAPRSQVLRSFELSIKLEEPPYFPLPSFAAHLHSHSGPLHAPQIVGSY